MSFPIHNALRGYKRHPLNTKLRLWHDGVWFDLPVNTSFGPLITNYLEKTHQVMHQELLSNLVYDHQAASLPV